jgi:hypothetical protein
MTGMIFGLCVAAVAGWNLWTGLRPGGEFITRWPFPPADRKHPTLFWYAALGNLLGIAIGLGLAAYEAFFRARF